MTDPSGCRCTGQHAPADTPASCFRRRRQGGGDDAEPKQLELFEKEHPGDSVQVDVKVVARGRSKWFQYTAIDDCTA